MYLDEIVAAQKRGEARGIASICSAHPDVLGQVIKVFDHPLIEATCNQVNQFGGYTGLTPAKFVDYICGIAKENHFPFENIILGGDHLGPSAWQSEPAESAMQKAEILVSEYVRAGFTKIHLDCSMCLADDSPGSLDVEVSARRATRLAKAAESNYPLSPRRIGMGDGLRYVIGTEVPIPGGATEHEDGVRVTSIDDARRTIEVTREAFRREGLESAWERGIAIVVQPGVEFGDDFVLPYQPENARDLSKFIEGQSMVYEAHSTDYQTRDSLKNLVRDHFAILKVGPALTFAFREAVFALATMENELFAESERSNILVTLEDVMLNHPAHWVNYYHGGKDEQTLKRRFSLSDRIRYYWPQPEIQTAFERLMKNLGEHTLPYSLLSQYVGVTNLNAAQVIRQKIKKVLDDYLAVCGENEQ